MKPTKKTLNSGHEALLEEVNRKLAQNSLIDFSSYMAPRWYKPVRHHEFVAGYLEQVARYIGMRWI